MEFKIGEKHLISINKWFIAPNGSEYRAIYGTINDISGSKGDLSVVVGSLAIPKSKILCAIKTDGCNFDEADSWQSIGGEVEVYKIPSKIYNADKVYVPKLRLCSED